RGAVESMAENASDAAVASLWWGAVAGLPGLLVHRGANTLDAMIGHHNDRYEHFGKVAAYLDDVVNWVPARFTGALAAGCASTVGGDRKTTWRVVRAEHGHHPSPNGGWCESAWAAALGVQLGGRNVYYGNRVEFRPLLGSGTRPDADKTADAARLVTTVTTAATWCAVAGLASVAHVLFYGGLIPRGLLPHSTRR
ncbi:cobalamin biosynthesis protein, partial [Cutibacterium acnes]